MNVKKYYQSKNKEFQDNLNQTVKGYTDKELNIHIEANKQRVEENLYCKICTSIKVKNFLNLLEAEQEKRKVKVLLNL